MAFVVRRWVAGNLPMPASAMAAQVEKQQGWLSSPWQRITKAVARLWPLFKTPRSSSFSLTKVGPLSFPAPIAHGESFQGLVSRV